MNTAWWVKRQSELNPAKKALIFEDQALTYAELHESACRAACWLDALGLKKGDRLALLLDNCPEFISLYLAASRLGVICVPLNYRLTPPELDYILRHSRPVLLVFAACFEHKLKPLDLTRARPPMLLSRVGELETKQVLKGEILDFRDEVLSFQGYEPYGGPSLGPSDPDEPQVIMYTSGTTGRPKGAVLTHRKTFFNCLNAEIFFDMSVDDLMLVILPLFHSGGLFIQATPTLYRGGTLLLHRRFDPQKALNDIEYYQVSKFLAVPTVYRALLNQIKGADYSLKSLKVCAIGGEKVTRELLEECFLAGFPVRQVMGQTETSILLWASEEESLARPGTQGRPVFHAEVRVVDKMGRQVNSGEVGEIVARGAVLMKEYWQDPEETEKTIRDGWLHTGDLARVDKGGYFYLVDRARDMYISGGENVYPAEVEKVLRSHPQVEDAAVVDRPHELWGQVGEAHVIAKRGKNPSSEDLLAWCAGRLAGYKRPHHIVFHTEFPRTPLGKVRKFLLRQTKEEAP
jgi:fatty-acyl-CoA synthase